MPRLVILFLTALVAWGCRDKPPPPAPAASAHHQTAPPAEGAICEHGVLQAICTKCNPRLIPVFQAKGDFCAEHGFPESVCPIHHPERGGKPVHAVTAETAPRDGLRVKFAREDTARVAGIKWERVMERKDSAAVVAPARLTYDATRLAQVNARSPGVVRTLKVDVGSKVKKGETLIVIDSPAVGADRARLSAAKTRVETAEQNLDRQQKLVAEGISASQTLLAAQQELSAAKAEYSALSASLSILGAGGGGLGGYALTAPIDGVVTERKATIGKLVETESVLLEIVDTRVMWADVEVPEIDLSRLSTGQAVTLQFQGVGDEERAGTIAYVAPAVDPHTSTARVRVPLDNADGRLRANMFGQAKITAGEARSLLRAPRSAVQRAGTTSFVFVRLRDVEFEVRRVKLGAGDAETVEITSGLRPGEDVVTTGSFLLKTETSKESIGAGCCAND